MVMSLSALGNNQEFDVIVVGAGMVGACAALGLGATGLSVLLVEAHPLAASEQSYTPSYDARSTALSWGSRDILSQLGVWSEIATQACPIKVVHVSERGRLGTTRLSADACQQEALGYVVPNQWLGQCLLNKLGSERLTVCSPAKVANIELGVDRHGISLSAEDSTPKSVSARLLVIADGSCSETAALLGIHNQVQDYGQHALIANITTELANQGIAYERFTEQGPLALLPLSDSTSALVWTHAAEQIQHYLALDDRAFCLRLQEVFGDRLGRITQCGKRSSYPLRLVRADEQYRSGVLLLGNAAHSLHPVAGQGFNLALRGVASFLEAIQHALAQQIPLASVKLFEHFAGLQQRDQTATILFSDQLVKIFGSHSPVLSVARDLGLVALDNLPLIKGAFARSAMGLAGKKARFGKARAGNSYG